MRPDLFATTLPFGDALARVMARAFPVSRTERIPVSEALSRVASADVIAPFDVPSFDRAAMDGFAVRAADVAAATSELPARLTCIGQVLTGEVPTRTVGPGECMEISTGAPVPGDADAVVMVERTSTHGRTISVRERVSVGQNVGRRGADLCEGQVAIRHGDYLTPARAGVLAAVGVDDVMVFARPSIAIFSSGPEIAASGHALLAGQIHDVNTHTLSAVVSQHGGLPVSMKPVADTIDDLASALVFAARHDVIVCSGGSSVGRKDLLTDALASCGDVIFHGIAVKPGKPTLFGRVGTTPLFGMPGNPTSCLSNAYLLLVPFLRALARLPPWRPTRVTVPLARRVQSSADRHQFYTVRLVNGQAEPAFKSSGDITSMAGADGYIEIPAEVSSLEAGDAVTVTLF